MEKKLGAVIFFWIIIWEAFGLLLVSEFRWPTFFFLFIILWLFTLGRPWCRSSTALLLFYSWNGVKKQQNIWFSSSSHFPRQSFVFVSYHLVPSSTIQGGGPTLKPPSMFPFFGGIDIYIYIHIKGVFTYRRVTHMFSVWFDFGEFFCQQTKTSDKIKIRKSQRRLCAIYPFKWTRNLSLSCLSLFSLCVWEKI